ncbi:MAG: PHP domain-containing protein [Elusimicrobia bacterium]|nr:PHP domain-containing protein [Elusimicrobiota bacterium]
MIIIQWKFPRRLPLHFDEETDYTIIRLYDYTMIRKNLITVVVLLLITLSPYHLITCLSAYDYISEKLHYGNIFYPPGDFDEGRRYPVIVNDTVWEYLKDSELEFNRMKVDENKFYEKSADIFFLNAVGFSNPSDAAQIYLKKKKHSEQDIAANSVFTLLNTQKIFVADDEIAIDTHLHTIYSHDSVADIEKLIIHADKKGLGAIAITDHNDFEGVRRARNIAEELKARGLIKNDFFIIPGEEISASDGHIVALFIKTYIYQNMSVSETIAEIHSQGGIAIAAHPSQKSGVGLKQMRSQKFDGVELYNGSSFLPYDFFRQTKIKKKLRKQKKFYVSSSDSHFKSGVGYSGCSIVSVQEKSLNGIKDAMKKGNLRPVLSGIYVPYKSFIEFSPIYSVYSVLSLYDDVKDIAEFMLAEITLSSNIKIKTNYDEQVHDTLNVIGVRKLSDEDSELKKPIKIFSVSATYGHAIFSYDFDTKETETLIKFMF